jgi:hypothetical protein
MKTRCPSKRGNSNREFRKRFEHFRFDSGGGRVEEELIDGRIFVD